ncbi:MAG: COG4223 family protein [Parvularculaceae bacterium]
MNTENHEDPAGDQPIEVDAELVNPAPEEENPSPSVKATGNRRLLMIVGAAAIAALVIVGVMLARRQIANDAPVADSAPEATERAAPAPQTIELPSVEPSPAPTAPTTPPEKIFNSTADAIKEGAAAIGESFSSGPGSINELPPPPPEGGANDDLQKAAKDAAKAFATPPTEIDLSDPQAALQSLEKVAASAPDEPPPAVEQAAPDAPNASDAQPAPPAATDNRAALEIARLEGSLAEQHQQAERQALEIARLQGEVARLQAEGAPVLRRARTALLFAALADKAQSGAPYRREYDAFAAVAGDISALAAYADNGLATEATLKADFEPALLDALNVARRAGATGPLSKLSANLASLVHLRPAGPRKGDGGVAVLSRAEAAVGQGDFAAAVETLGALDAVTRAPLNAWIARARARAAADQAVAEARKAYASAASEPASL